MICNSSMYNYKSTYRMHLGFIDQNIILEYLNFFSFILAGIQNE